MDVGDWKRCTDRYADSGQNFVTSWRLNKYISLCYFLQGEKSNVYQNVHGVRESMVSKLECID